MPTETLSPAKKYFRIFLICLAIALLIRETMVLYTFPTPESARWPGDETWLMREYMTLTSTGIMRYPEAKGSSIEHGNNFLTSTWWTTALLYGVPANIAGPRTDVVAVGRTISFLLSLLSLVLLYRIVRLLGGDPIIALVSCIVLIATRDFYIAAHCTRYDMITMSYLLFMLYLPLRESAQPIAPYKRRNWWFIYGIAWGFALTISPHAVILSFPLVVATAWVCGRRDRNLVPLALGAVAVVAVLGVLYLILNRNEVTIAKPLYPTNGFILRQFPKVHLDWHEMRFQYFHLLQDAPLLLYWVLALIPLGAWLMVTHRQHVSTLRRPALLSCLLVAIVWYFVDTSRMYAITYIVPFILVACALITIRSFETYRWLNRIQLLIITLALIGIVFSFQKDIGYATQWGQTLTTNNNRAIDSIANTISKEPMFEGGWDVMSRPAIHRLLTHSGLRVINASCMDLPMDSMPDPVGILHRYHIRYMIVADSLPVLHGMTADGIPVTCRLDSICERMLTIRGAFTDVGEPYFRPFDNRVEYVSLFRVKD